MFEQITNPFGLFSKPKAKGSVKDPDVCTLVFASNFQRYVFYLNPTTLSFDWEKQGFEEFTRTGWTAMPISDNKLTVSCSGTIGAFYADKTGITTYKRKSSDSFKSFRQLFFNYFMSDSFSFFGLPAMQSGKYPLVLTSTVYLFYSNHIIEGYMEGFTFTEDQPFAITYQFSMNGRYYFNKLMPSTFTTLIKRASHFVGSLSQYGTLAEGAINQTVDTVKKLPSTVGNFFKSENLDKIKVSF